jgi:hypothetical protein
MDRRDGRSGRHSEVDVNRLDVSLGRPTLEGEARGGSRPPVLFGPYLQERKRDKKGVDHV